MNSKGIGGSSAEGTASSRVNGWPSTAAIDDGTKKCGPGGLGLPAKPVTLNPPGAAGRRPRRAQRT